MNPRTARAVAAILSQTRADEALRGLNQSDGRNQSEQASFLAAESPFLREIYERGGTVVDGVLTVPKENLSASAEIEIATTPAAVERLTKITNDDKSRKFPNRTIRPIGGNRLVKAKKFQIRTRFQKQVFAPVINTSKPKSLKPKKQPSKKKDEPDEMPF